LVLGSWRPWRWPIVLQDGLIALIITAAVGWLVHAGTLRPVDGLLRDIAAWVLPDPPPRDDLLLVEMSTATDRAADWRTAVEELRRLGARQIVFVDAPVGAELALASTGATADLLLGVAANLDRRQAGRWSAARPLLPTLPPHLGMSVVGPAEFGIHRRHLLEIDIGGARYPTIEALAAARLAADDGRDAEFPDSYLIDYSSGIAALPKTALDRIVAGELVESLVEGRTVLIGADPASSNARIHVPLFLESPWIGKLEYHGFALQTLLSGDIVRELHPAAATALIGGLLIFIVVFAYLAGQRFAPAIVLAVMAAVILASVPLLAFLDRSLPLVALLLALGAYLAVAVLHRMRARAQMLERLVRDVSVRVRERLNPTTAVGEEKPWAQVAAMATELLELNRCMFFETIPGQARVRETEALGCGFDDIAERRRDYRRSPYADAIAAGGPTRTQRQVLKARGEDEDQFLAPLVFGGDLLGFWAFSVPRERWTNSPGFMTLARAFTERASDYLAGVRQRAILLGADPDKRVLANPVAGDDAGSEFRLSPLLELLNRRLVLAEEVLTGISTATIVFDAFGRVLHANKQMRRLLTVVEMSATETTPLELVTKLTDVPEEHVRRYLRYVMLEEGTISVPTQATSGGKRYLLYISSIDPLPQRERVSNEPLSMLRAVLCELLDITAIDRLFSMKEVMSEHLNFRLRNSLAAMFMAAELLNSKNLTEERRGQILENLKNTIKLSKEAFERFESMLDVPLVSDLAERYPVDLRMAAMDAISANEADAARREVEIEADIPEAVSLVVGGRQELVGLIRTLLLMMIQDAEERSSIRVQLREGDTDVTLKIENKGFGLPQERLNAYLTGPEEPQTSTFKLIRLGRMDAERWGGRLEAYSTLGAGFRFDLTLPKVA
jgi:CHASE2 domain-containing sensor protein/signal transduction histidine kinase